MHDRPECLRNVAADNEPPEEVFVPVAIQYLSIMSEKNFSRSTARSDMEQIVVLHFRTVPGVPAPFHILNG